MGRRGPKPTPTPILKLRGTLREGRSRGEPIPHKDMPECPDWIDEEGKHAWAEIVPILKQMGVLTKIDRNALTRYCQTWSRWKKAELFIQKNGEVYTLKDDAGKIKIIQQFPQVSIANKAGQALTKLEAEFGMTPSSRSRITVPESAHDHAAQAKQRFFKAG